MIVWTVAVLILFLIHLGCDCPFLQQNTSWHLMAQENQNQLDHQHCICSSFSLYRGGMRSDHSQNSTDRIRTPFLALHCKTFFSRKELKSVRQFVFSPRKGTPPRQQARPLRPDSDGWDFLLRANSAGIARFAAAAAALIPQTGSPRLDGVTRTTVTHTGLATSRAGGPGPVHRARTHARS
jgi:hypothetical protein